MTKVLIVDDNPESRELLRTLCAHRGLETREAGDGAEALALAREERPGLVITDVLMPTMDGYELVRQLRAAPETAAVPVIFCTAHYLTQEAHALAEQCGVGTVLTKPVEPERVLETIDQALSREPPAASNVPTPTPEKLDREHLRLVTDKLSRTSSELRTTNEKLSALVELSISTSTERDPARLLEGFSRAARSLGGARYAGAATWNRGVERSVDHWCALGLPDEVRGALEPPSVPSFLSEGKIEDRCERLSGHGAVAPPGLPGNHPAVGSLLMGPILSMERLYGWVYVADKLGLDAFTADDELLIGTLAKQLGRLYENGKLYHQLAERELQLSALFESAMDAMIIADDEGSYLNANPAAAELFGVPREELIGRHPWEFAERAEEVRKRWKDFLDAGRMSGEFELRRPDGQVRHLDFRATANFLPGRHLSILRDVTENKRLEERLRHTAKMEAIGRLAGGIAHDFNNLLTVITGYAELVLNALPPGDPQAGLVEEIRAAGERSAALTGQLLAFSRRQVLSPVVVDLNEVVRRMERLLERIIGEDVRLKTKLARNLGRCRVDPAQIEQVLMNLAVNSRDAMPGGGRLLIETEDVDIDPESAELHGTEPGPYVLLAVSDTGVGMDRETLSHLFEPFFTTKGPGRGTGLGLATVYGIVTQSGGHINAYSESGSGATFKIYFPRVEEPVARPKPRPQEDERGTETILLVEDDDAVRRLTARMLGRLGYTVIEAEGIEDAQARVEELGGRLDLLVTDVVMPDGSGRSLAERISKSHPESRVLFMSGYTDNAVAEHGILEKNVVFLQKPFTSASLSRKVREALDR